jgi:hypothetical protein
MTYVESAITRAWLVRHGPEYDEISFNVRLGEGQDVGQQYSPEIQHMAQLVTQKRSDIVARAGDQVDLIEVKVRIAFGVIGQLIGYRGLWRLQRPDLAVRRIIAIGRSVVPDMAAIIEEAGVIIETYPRPE